MEVIDFIRVRDRKIVEHWNIVDQLGLMRQLGVMPEPPSGRAGKSWSPVPTSPIHYGGNRPSRYREGTRSHAAACASE